MASLSTSSSSRPSRARGAGSGAALRPGRRQAVENLLLDALDESVGVASRHAHERPGPRVVVAVERPDVVQRQRGQSFLRPDGGRFVRVARVQQRVQGLLAQLLVVAAAQRGNDGVGQEVPVPDEVRLVEPRRHHQVAHDGEERLEVIAVHLADQHRHLLVGLRANRRGPGIERLGDLPEAQRLGAAAPHHHRGQGVQAVLPRRIVDRAGAETDAQGHQRRVRGRQCDDDGVFGARSRRAAAGRGGAGEHGEHETEHGGRPEAATRREPPRRNRRRDCPSCCQRGHRASSWVRITTVRLVSAK